MKYIKMKRESMWGKAGTVVEVSDGIARGHIADGSAVVVDSKPVRKSRKKVSNKAMSAKTE